MIKYSSLCLLILYSLLVVSAVVSADAELQPKPELFRSNSIGKPNKISAALRFIHRKSGESVYGRAGSRTPSLEPPPDYNGMTDEQVLMSFCHASLTRFCEKTVKRLIQRSPEKIAEIVQAVRDRPEDVAADQLIMHKLFETFVDSMEEKGYDEKIDWVLNFALKRNPYTAVGSRIMDYAIKRSHSKQTDQMKKEAEMRNSI